MEAVAGWTGPERAAAGDVGADPGACAPRPTTPPQSRPNGDHGDGTCALRADASDVDLTQVAEGRPGKPGRPGLHGSPHATLT